MAVSEPLDHDTCMRLHGQAFAVQHRGGVLGWYPNMVEALEAARGAGIELRYGTYVGANVNPSAAPR